MPVEQVIHKIQHDIGGVDVGKALCTSGVGGSPSFLLMSSSTSKVSVLEILFRFN